ncbi:MAG: single-stranded DNA-binding protein [Actinomycetota bacterium]|nr:single-stranded DNA-binding protein [Actinomycetota bacterium]
MYMNTVAIAGNLTSDPKMGTGQGKVVNFRLAINKNRRQSINTGELASLSEEESHQIKERTEFIDVECWGSQADNVYHSLKKGDRAIVFGQMKYDQWTDEDGKTKSKVSIRASVIGASLEFATARIERQSNSTETETSNAFRDIAQGAKGKQKGA